jgi:hypothetical protein
MRPSEVRLKFLFTLLILSGLWAFIAVCIHTSAIVGLGPFFALIAIISICGLWGWLE